MKSLTLFKQTRNIQLGHLYEHIFCDYVTKYLFNEGVFASIDYVLDGKTYHGGIITIEFAAYTEQAEAQIEAIKTLTPVINEEVMYTSWNQLESEKQMVFGYSSLDEIIEGLKKLDTSPWTTFDELDVIDVNDLHRQAMPFYISTDKLKPTKLLTIDLYIENTAPIRELLPLANRLLSGIGANLQFFLTRELGIYFDNESMHYRKKRLTYRLKFKTYPEFDFSDEELSGAVRYIARQLEEKEACKRLCNDLGSIPNSLEYWVSPPIQWLYESSYQVVGARGWKRIANEKNAKKLLNEIHVEAKFGNRKIEL